MRAFKDQDSKNTLSTVELIGKGDLIIRDLAYAGLDALQGIVKHHAYYLCQLQSGVKVYEYKDNEYVELDFVGLREKMQRDGMPLVDKSVYLGKKDKRDTP